MAPRPVLVTGVSDDGSANATWTFDREVVYSAGLEPALELYAPGPGWDEFTIDSPGTGTTVSGFMPFGGFTAWRILSTPAKVAPAVGAIAIPQTGAVP